MLTLLRARNPRWDDAAQTSISLYVTFEETEQEMGEMPFTAHAHDCEDHGREIFERATRGDFGQIEAFEPSALSEQMQRNVRKLRRDERVAAITVTTDQGHTFDGNEKSQSRMVRMIAALQSLPCGSVIPWTMADNTVVNIGIDELRQALARAVLQQAELWVN